MRSIPNQASILSKHTPRYWSSRRLPLRQPPLQLRRIHPHINRMAGGIDGNLITILHHSNWTPDRRLRTDMSHDKPVRSTGVPPVGDERDILQPGAHDRRRSLQLLWHARSAFGALVSDYED